MLFEPVLHESVADELRSAFPNWDGDTRKLDIRVPLSARPFERTRLIVSIKGDESKTHELVVVSLRALFRGEGQLVIDRTDFKDEYIPFFEDLKYYRQIKADIAANGLETALKQSTRKVTPPTV